MDVSIVFVNYKTEALLLDCLRSIYEHTIGVDFECIVVDNHFIPGANQQILEAFPATQWIDSGGNLGFSKANNIGLAVAKGDYVLFLNADTLVFDSAITNAYQHLTSDSELIAVGGIQLDAKHNPIPFYRTLNDTRRDFYIVPNKSIFHQLINRFLPKESFSRPEETNNLVGAFIMASKERLLNLKGWDEDFFMYAEDVELSCRLNKFGKLAYFENVKFIHLIQDNPYRRTKYSWVNRFSIQVQVSNLLWIRKSYGILAFLLIYLNYASLAPIFWIWKITLNLLKGKVWHHDTTNQRIFSRKVAILFRYFFPILFLQKGPYQIKEDENIDQVNKS
ncbi:glycosyltransferase [Aquirufa sp.]|jgi:GT2 family glycosyltransferase|uniref:glycosyltransferase n=1 Tax=Aquirufa sp. TaxID=2676249 RepID=UPI0037C03B7E